MNEQEQIRRERMEIQKLAKKIDFHLNGNARGTDRKTAFALLMFPSDGPRAGNVNYVGSGGRDEIHQAMAALMTRWDGEPKA